MSAERLSLTQEPRAKVYRNLIAQARRHCDQFLLVVRGEVGKSTSLLRALNDLQPFLIEQAQAAEWPGTLLLDGEAVVSRYRLCEESVELLTKLADGLYDWQQPDLPEDLCLLRRGGEPWLVSISHERDAYLDLLDHEMAAVQDDLPELLVSDSRSR